MTANLLSPRRQWRRRHDAGATGPPRRDHGDRHRVGTSPRDGAEAGRRNACFYDFWAGRRNAEAFRARLRDDLTEVLRLLADGTLAPQIAAMLPLSEAAAALTLAVSRTVTGKVVLVPDAR
ncbi:zinc-binding dehydrogenase [Nonomuraea angiospora]|uniref:zinc-binding dehydrogenase n=1 Tax=Nonomuraea angiospora TaxID=46172 RepID=UPI0036B7E012